MQHWFFMMLFSFALSLIRWHLLQWLKLKYFISYLVFLQSMNKQDLLGKMSTSALGLHKYDDFQLRSITYQMKSSIPCRSSNILFHIRFLTKHQSCKKMFNTTLGFYMMHFQIGSFTHKMTSPILSHSSSISFYIWFLKKCEQARLIRQKFLLQHWVCL